MDMHLADKIGVQHAFIIPAVCYVYIALFGYLGGRHAEREIAEIEAAQGAA